jgi:copper chaperone CopZ
MLRRKFLSSTSLALAATGMQAEAAKTVTYHVKGFTCVTCAVGLDTLMTRQKGVLSCKSSFAAATSVIAFHPELITEETIRNCIAELGFTATRA